VLLIELEPTSRPRRLRRLQSIYKRCLKEGSRVLDLNRLELFRAKTEQLQNSRGDLRRLYRRRDIQAARRSGPCYHDGNISILGVIAPVLGDLALMTGIDNPVLSDANHVWYSGITLGDPAQKLPTSRTNGNLSGGAAGGYLADGATPGPVLTNALDFVDQSLGKMVSALGSRGLLNSTAIIVSAKHGKMVFTCRYLSG
jgi:hypothetical protein